MDSTRELQGGTVNDAALAEIVGTYQAQDVRVSYEDMANPRRYGVVVEHRAGEFRIVWDGDDGETWSDLRQAGWRRETSNDRYTTLIESMAQQIADENPLDAIRGWLAGSEAYGLTWESKLYRRAVEIAETRNDHSASRRVDVLAAEAPHLLAQPDEPRPFTLRVVVNMEADEPELLGTWQETDDVQVWYTTSDGHYRWAPYDCVRVVSVTL
jgi:hypothetical protein